MMVSKSSEGVVFSEQPRMLSTWLVFSVPDVLLDKLLEVVRILEVLPLLFLNLASFGSLVPDVNGVGVSLRRLAVTSLELVVKLLEGCMAKGADTDCTVALVNNHLLEILDRVLVPPVTDDFHVTLAAHIDVLMLSPVSASLGFSFGLAFWLGSLSLLAHFEPKDSVVVVVFHTDILSQEAGSDMFMAAGFQAALFIEEPELSLGILFPGSDQLVVIEAGLLSTHKLLV